MGLFSYGGGWGCWIHLASTQGKDPLSPNPRWELRQRVGGGRVPWRAAQSSKDPSCALLGLLRFTGPKRFIHKIQMGLRALLLTRAGGRA